MQEKLIQPDVVAYNTLMSACARAGEIQKLKDVYSLMKSKGICADLVTYGVLMTTLNNKGRPRQALGVFKQISFPTEQNSERIFCAAVSTCTKLDHRSLKALKIYEQIQIVNLKPNIKLSAQLLRVLGSADDIETVFTISQNMRRKGHVLGPKIWSVLIQLCVSNGVRKNGYKILKQLTKKKHKYKGGHAIFQESCELLMGTNKLIASYVKEGSFKNIYNILKLMHELKMKPDKATFSILINACTQCENRDLGIDLYYTLCQNEVKLDDILANNILRLCKRQCELLRAEIKLKNWNPLRNPFGDAIIFLLGVNPLLVIKSGFWEKFTMQTYQET